MTVVSANRGFDRTEIEGEIDESLSAKWSTWNTLGVLSGQFLSIRGNGCGPELRPSR